MTILLYAKAPLSFSESKLKFALLFLENQSNLASIQNYLFQKNQVTFTESISEKLSSVQWPFLTKQRWRGKNKAIHMKCVPILFTSTAMKQKENINR